MEAPLSHVRPSTFLGAAQAVGRLNRLWAMIHSQKSRRRQSHSHGLPSRVRLLRALLVGLIIEFSQFK